MCESVCMCVCERERQRQRESKNPNERERVFVELLCIFSALGCPFLLLQLPPGLAHPIVRVIRPIENEGTLGNFDEDRPSYLLLLLQANVAPQTPTPIYNPATFTHFENLRENQKKLFKMSIVCPLQCWL